MAIKQKKHEIDMERINPELRDKIVFIPAKRKSLSFEAVEAFFGGDMTALQDITKLAKQQPVESNE